MLRGLDHTDSSDTQMLRGLDHTFSADIQMLRGLDYKQIQQTNNLY